MDKGLILSKLRKSRFRRSFKLKDKELKYVNDKGLEVMKKHASDFLNQKLKVYDKAKDGKQTPYSGHPVFIAQHALALCCRNCMKKWYGIPKERELTDVEIENFSELISSWISLEASY